MSTTARIALVAVILVPLLVVGVLLLLANRQTAPYTGQIDAVAFNRAIADGDARLAEGDYEAALSSYDQAEAANPSRPRRPSSAATSTWPRDRPTRPSSSTTQPSRKTPPTRWPTFRSVRSTAPRATPAQPSPSTSARCGSTPPSPTLTSRWAASTRSAANWRALGRAVQRGAARCGQRPARPRLGADPPGQSGGAARQDRPGHCPLPAGPAGRPRLCRFLHPVGPDLPGASATRLGAGTVPGRRTKRARQRRRPLLSGTDLQPGWASWTRPKAELSEAIRLAP